MKKATNFELETKDILMYDAEEQGFPQYQDLGPLDEYNKIRLKRNLHSGTIYVEKHLPGDCAPVYEYLSCHPNPYVPKIIEYTLADKSLILTEEYIEGKTLDEIMEERRIEEDEALQIIYSMCEALRPLHQADPAIICRDLKAENIMLDNGGNIKIVDFDIARVYQPGKKRDTRLLGTKEYAAPEQFGFGQTDARTDIYALGVLLNYMLIHKFPAEEIAPGPFSEIIKKCIRMDPEQRYQNVDELVAALKKLETTRGQHRNHNRDSDREEIHRRSFLPPGFRTKTPWKMILSSAVYMLMLSFFFTLEITNESGQVPTGLKRIEQTILFASQIMFIDIVFDYRGVRKRLPLLRNNKIAVRLIGVFLTEAILYLAAIWIIVFFEAAIL